MVGFQPAMLGFLLKGFKQIGKKIFAIQPFYPERRSESSPQAVEQHWSRQEFGAGRGCFKENFYLTDRN
jgi:hypothetical protein